MLFSFDQEKLMNQFKSIQVNHNKYANYLRKQSNLREHFAHVDDSLFALSLRQPKIAEVREEPSDLYPILRYHKKIGIAGSWSTRCSKSSSSDTSHQYIYC